MIKLGYPLANLGHNIKIPHYNRPNKNCQCFSLLIGFGIFIGIIGIGLPCMLLIIPLEIGLGIGIISICLGFFLPIIFI